MGSVIAACGLLSGCGVWVFLSLVVARGLCSLQPAGSLTEAPVGSVVVARGLSGPTACGILVPRTGIEPTFPLHWKADSLPLDHQGSPARFV